MAFPPDLSQARPLDLDQLPRHSPWPARLLGAEAFAQRSKEPAEIEREYEREKWGGLLDRAAGHAGRLAVTDLDAWYYGPDQPIPSLFVGRLWLIARDRAVAAYRAMIEQAVAAFLPAPAVAELGAGYGGSLIRMAQSPRFAGLPCFAGEYTPSGCELIRRVGRDQGLAVAVAACDLARAGATPWDLPPGALVYTAFAACYLTVMDDAFVEGLMALRPKAVIHIEPCYEHADPMSLLGLMQRRYIALNGYNTNLVDLLKRHQAAGRIRILREDAQVMAVNPFLPASVVVWTPAA